MTRSAVKPVRCAIYTRVSSDARLEQDFNSLDAQREACEAYIKSQTHEGWRLLRNKFDDGGFSGGSIDRPALQRLLAAIREHKLDVIVVYKVDRLTRSLADFAKLVELFDAHEVSFVSITQSFNTTTSMGRLTLNVLLSFAQYEREVTGERIRDKIAASKKKGLWMGGVVPLGYRVEDRKLLIDPAEAETVRLIFTRYRDLGALSAVQRDLRNRGIVTRTRKLSSGRIIGGVPLTNGPLLLILHNRTYIGEINHRDRSYPGEHEAIIEPELFEAVQRTLERNRHDRRKQRSSGALLLGKLFDDRGNRMTPSFAIKKGVRYRYYVSSVVTQGRKEDAGSQPRVPAQAIEDQVAAALLRHMTTSQSNGGTASAPDEPSIRAFLRDSVDRITLGSEQITIEFTSANSNGGVPEPICIPWTAPSQRRQRAIITADDVSKPNSRANRSTMRPEGRARLLVKIAMARAWLDELLCGEVSDLATLADRTTRTERSVRMILSLAFLAPDIVEAAIQGTLPRGVSVTKMTELPCDWDEQHRALGLPIIAR